MHSDHIPPPSLTDQRGVAQQVLLTMANIDVLSEEATDTAPSFTQDPLVSLLRYAAPVNQILLLECSPQLAFQLTSCLFDRPEPTSVSDEDVLDTMGELVNMIGGNLKALMPPETFISLPAVSLQGEGRSLTHSAKQLSKAWLNTTSGMLCLTFFESKPDAEVELHTAAPEFFYPGLQTTEHKHHTGFTPTKEN